MGACCRCFLLLRRATTGRPVDERNALLAEVARAEERGYVVCCHCLSNPCLSTCSPDIGSLKVLRTAATDAVWRGRTNRAPEAVSCRFDPVQACYLRWSLTNHWGGRGVTLKHANFKYFSLLGGGGPPPKVLCQDGDALVCGLAAALCFRARRRNKAYSINARRPSPRSSKLNPSL